MVGSGRSSLSIIEISRKFSDLRIMNYYLGITTIPCLIHSPLRMDQHPSLGLYSVDGKRIYFNDFATNQTGDIYELLRLMWGISLEDTLDKINKEVPLTKEIYGEIHKDINNHFIIRNLKDYSENTELHCKIREWRKYDLEYWESYGISLEWLKYADVYPISHKIVVKEGKTYIFGADKLAYAYVERKEGKITLKIYQPYNKQYKWSNKHDSSVISLWAKVPKEGDKIVICSSLKDALCLWSNTNIPAIAIQGEGYNISQSALNSLKERYKNIYILLDNDARGLFNGQRLASITGFKNIILPEFPGGKDISDYYFYLKNKNIFKSYMLDLIQN